MLKFCCMYFRHINLFRSADNVLSASYHFTNICHSISFFVCSCIQFLNILSNICAVQQSNPIVVMYRSSPSLFIGTINACQLFLFSFFFVTAKFALVANKFVLLFLSCTLLCHLLCDQLQEQAASHRHILIFDNTFFVPLCIFWKS